MSDNVNQPDHYANSGIETIDYIKDKLTPEEWLGYIKGQVLKYTSRSGKKGDGNEDLQKAMWYLNFYLHGSKNIRQ